MSKSSLCKIVRTYIEQAKDGSTGYYNQTKPVQPNAFGPKKPQPPTKPMAQSQTGKPGGSMTYTEQRTALRKTKASPDPPVHTAGSRTASLNASALLQNSQSKPKLMQTIKDSSKTAIKVNLISVEDKPKERGRPPLTRNRNQSNKTDNQTPTDLGGDSDGAENIHEEARSQSQSS